jgi:2-oxo-3-hexenedioate decarboxylase
MDNELANDASITSHEAVEALAREVVTASETGQMILVPFSARPGFDLNTAYEVEAFSKRLREANGHKVVGRKVGYANKAMWRMLKLDTLVWGHMYDDTVHYADNNSAILTIANARSLKIEPEIVFGLKRSMAADLDACAALESTDWLALGFEIIDCPFPGWQFQPSDFVASYGLHVALVVGARIAVRPESIPQLLDDLPRFKVRMLKSRELVEEGSGKNSLRSPALCLAELASAVTKRSPNEPLAAGEIISTGTLTAGHALEEGDVWTAEVTGLAVPTLTLTLV